MAESHDVVLDSMSTWSSSAARNMNQICICTSWGFANDVKVNGAASNGLISFTHQREGVGSAAPKLLDQSVDGKGGLGLRRQESFELKKFCSLSNQSWRERVL